MGKNEDKCCYSELSIQDKTQYPDLKSYKLKLNDPSSHSISLLDLGKINIFVGANNSGKSRFLRELFRNQNIALTIHDELYVQMLTKCIPRTMPSYEPTGFIIRNEQFEICEHQRNIASNSGLVTGLRENIKYFEFPDRIYIPVLRGLRPLKFTGDESDSYLKRTMGDYFETRRIGERTEKVEQANIFTGLQFYEKLKQLLLGKHEGRKNVKEYEVYLSEHFFGGKEITMIPNIEKDSITLKIGSEEDRFIYELGDGMQSLIILTFPIFTAPEKTLFFIEEPELSMHPGLLRQFLEFLQNQERHQFFITTHSNHLLDMSLDYDLSIYRFTREEKDNTFVIDNVSCASREVLSDLGVKSSSVFLTNATIWVEGITDRLYLRVYLERYQQENEKINKNFIRIFEDRHYSFMEYQGSNIEHWLFDSEKSDDEDIERNINASFFCSNPFVVADGDIINKGNREEDLLQQLKNNLFVLKCKEIENLTPEIVLKEVVRKKFEKNNGNIDSIKIDEYGNWNNNDMVGIGSYLDQLLEKNSIFAMKSGTIKNKVIHCKKCIRYMQVNPDKWELTDPLKELCSKIYEFVKQENSL